MGLRCLNAKPADFPDVLDTDWPGVLTFIKNVVGTLQTLQIYGGNNLKIEKQIGDPMFGGTPDISAYSAKEKLLIIWDYKNGRNRVEAYENWQGISYAWLLNPPSDTVVQIRIIQPNAWSKTGPIKTWKTNMTSLQPYFQQLKSAMNSAQSNNPLAKTGTYCRYCKGRHMCQQLATEAMEWVEMTTRGEPVLQTPDEIGRELTILENARITLDHRFTALQQQALWHAEQGKPVYGYHIERGVGSLVWSDEGAAIKAAAATGVGISTEKACTPTQAKKAGLHPAVIKQFSKRLPGKTKLVRDDTAEARRIFGNE